MNVGLSLSANASIAAAASTISVPPAISPPTIPSGAVAGGRYRYRALDSQSGDNAFITSARPPLRFARSAAESAANPAPGADDINRLLQLRQPASEYHLDRIELNAVLRYLNPCSMHNSTENASPMAAWWARLRGYEISNAEDDLQRIDRLLRTLFFDTPPSQRTVEWQRVSSRARRDINLMIDLGEVVRTSGLISDRPSANIEAVHLRLARILQTEAAADLSLRATDTPCLIVLAQILREHDAVNDPYFQNRVATTSEDVCAFVKNDISQAGASDADDAGAGPYRLQREKDLSALLYRTVRDRCSSPANSPLTLASLRQGLDGALQADANDQIFLAGLFADNGAPDSIHHDGWVLRNAAGKTPRDLIAYLDTHAAPGFAQLGDRYKLSLIERKLYELGEYPGGYRFGSIKRAMATVLMRTSNQPPANRYFIYHSAFELESRWTQRMQEEIDKGTMPYMLEIIEAIYNERANGVGKWTAKHYRAHYVALVEKIEAALSANTAMTTACTAAWQWLAQHMPPWRAASRDFDNTISVKQYAVSIKKAVDAFYQIAQATHLPRSVITDAWAGLSTTEFHDSLKGLPYDAGMALSQAAKAFDYSPFYREHVVSDNDNPAFTLAQKMESTYCRTALELRAAPFWTVETEAYKILLANNISVEQMTEGRAAIYSNVHSGKYYQRPRPVHEAFVTVIRNVDEAQMLFLPTGKVIQPYRMIKKSFADFNNGLTAHPYILGSALQYMRDNKLPFLPSVRKAQIERFADKFRVTRITTELGTQLADELLGSLPICAPTLQLVRAWLDGKGHKFYYVLLIARDILATAAMTKMTFAAYIRPLISGMRLSTSALLAARMLPSKTMVSVRRYRANSMGYIDFDTPRKKTMPSAQKQHDIPLIGDQTRGYQSRTNRARSGGNAARRIAEDKAPGNATLTNAGDGDIDPDNWLDFMRLIAPALAQNARSFHSMLKLGRNAQTAMLEMRFTENMEDAGARAGLTGLTSANGATWCDGQALQDRQTVRDIMNWQIKFPDDSAYNRRAIHGNVRIETADATEAAWIEHPDWRYNPLGIISQAFDASPILRQLFNAYDVQPVEPGSIRITVDTQSIPPEITQRGSLIHIDLPADPHCLPFTKNARHVAKQSITSALIEGVVTALTSRPAMGNLAPRNPTRERGLRIWLANRILLQIDHRTDPRVNAATYPTREHAQHAGNQKIREAAELEDQYLERVNPGNPITARLHQFPRIARNPTVRAVMALAQRIGFSARSRADNPAVQRAAAAGPDSLSRGHFLSRFRKRFAIEVAHLARLNGDQLIETSHFFFHQCYKNSPLFQKIFDYGLRRHEQQWVIFPAGYAGDSGIEDDILIPAPGIINAGTENGLYLGLIEIQANPKDEAHPLPTSSLRPLEPFRRMLDGVIAALVGDYVAMSRESAFEHRGAIGWASDMVLQQIMRDAETFPNKRLVQIAVSATNADDCRRLRKMAPQKRGQARDEDAYLDYWFAEIELSATGAPPLVSSSMASP